MQYVTIMNFVLFAFLTFIWSTRTWINTIIKFFLFSATVMNIVVAAIQFGFIIKQ